MVQELQGALFLSLAYRHLGDNSPLPGSALEVLLGCAVVFFLVAFLALFLCFFPGLPGIVKDFYDVVCGIVGYDDTVEENFPGKV